MRLIQATGYPLVVDETATIMLKNIPGIPIRLHYPDAHGAILLICNGFHFVLDQSARSIRANSMVRIRYILGNVRHLVIGIAFDKLGYVWSQRFRHGFEFIC